MYGQTAPTQVVRRSTSWYGARDLIGVAGIGLREEGAVVPEGDTIYQVAQLLRDQLAGKTLQLSVRRF